MIIIDSQGRIEQQDHPLVVTVVGSGSVGPGTPNYLAKWVTTTTLGDSLIQDNGVGVSIGGTPSSSYTFWVQSGVTRLGGSVLVNAISATGYQFYINQAVATSGTPTAFAVAGGEHTTLTATEAIDVRFFLGRTVQFSTGDRAWQRAFVIEAPIYAFVGPTTIDDAATFAIDGSPTPGTNATLTRRHAFWVQGGMTTLARGLNVGLATGATGVGWVYITQAGVATGGSPSLMVVAGGAHTSLTASVEAIDINFNLTRTVQFAQGALATQRAVVFQAPTYAFVGASTLTTAATVAITDAPVAGTNATITNPLALWVQTGAILHGAYDSGNAFRVWFNINAAIAATPTMTSAVILGLFGTITANANGDLLRGAIIYPVYAKGAKTALFAIGLQITAGTPTGAGTISQYTGLSITEQTFATANVSLLVGNHPGGSTNYSMYINSTNTLFLGSGAVRLDSQNSTGANTTTFTATNKPGSGVTLTPQTWLKINLGGTDYYIPCWI